LSAAHRKSRLCRGRRRSWRRRSWRRRSWRRRSWLAGHVVPYCLFYPLVCTCPHVLFNDTSGIRNQNARYVLHVYLVGSHYDLSQVLIVDTDVLNGGQTGNVYRRLADNRKQMLARW
jgi:hypothetical protein